MPRREKNFSAWAGVSASISIRMLGWASRKRSTISCRAAGSRPVARWLSFTMTMSWRPRRWLVAPPEAAAAFSRRRRPGVVLRVSRILAPVPAMASANRRASVATPERRWMKFSAVRSAVRIGAAGPVTVRAAVPFSRRVPSAWWISISSVGPTRRKTSAAVAVPARMQSWRAMRRAVAVAPGRVKWRAVTSPGPMSSARARSMMSGRSLAMEGWKIRLRGPLRGFRARAGGVANP